MKIKKNTAVKANVDCELASCVAVPAPSPVSLCKYNDAICSIQVAIESLALIAQDDQVAKESIANLSVVLMDLKSNC